MSRKLSYAMAISMLLIRVPTYAAEDSAFVVSPYLGNFDRPGAVAYLVKDAAGHWQFAVSADVKNDGVERIRVDFSASAPVVYLDAPSFNANGELIPPHTPGGPQNFDVCVKGHTADLSRVSGHYSPCNSELTTLKTGASLLTGLLTAPFELSKGMASYLIRVDQDKLKAAVTESGAIPALRQQIADAQVAERHRAYLAAFETAKTSSQLNDAIASYTDNDPDHLIPDALVRRDQLRADENATAKRLADEQQRQERERVRLAKLDEGRTIAFRRQLKVGDGSSCGPVIDLKRPAAKVQALAGQVWLPIDQLDPVGKSCSASINVAKTVKQDPDRDAQGRQIIYGPVRGQFYANVHIISKTVGVELIGGATIMNSVIEAPVCVTSPGGGLELINNELRCGQCVVFESGVLLSNVLSGNTCAGAMTNRPDVFGG